MIGEDIPHAIELLVGLLALASIVAIRARPPHLPATVPPGDAGLAHRIAPTLPAHPPPLPPGPVPRRVPPARSNHG